MTHERKVPDYVFEVDPAELYCRVLEAGARAKRPPDLSARAAWTEVRRDHPELAAEIEREADAAARYMAECIEPDRARRISQSADEPEHENEPAMTRRYAWIERKPTAKAHILGPNGKTLCKAENGIAKPFDGYGTSVPEGRRVCAMCMNLSKDTP